METQRFHVVLDGKKVGPYERRTLAGLRVKGTLVGEHVLLGTDGTQLTLAELLDPPKAGPGFDAQRTGGHSLVLGSFPGELRGVSAGIDLPAFVGELEIRVQRDVLRIAGRHRQGFNWKDDRVKIPVGSIVHAGAYGTEVAVGIRGGDGSLSQLRLDLGTPQAARSLVALLANASPWPSPPEDKLPRPGSPGWLSWLAR